MGKKPVIGISGSIMIDQGGMFPGYKRAYVNDDYILAIHKNGGIPMMLPLVDDEEVIKEQIKNIDGLLLSGGHDVDPMFYDEEPSQKLGETFPERDIFDMKLIKYALEMKKPIMGVCRGMQMINVYFGGSLYQDLSFIDGCTIKHVQGHTPSLATHTANITEGTKLETILGTNKTLINSFHHLAAKEIGKGLVVSARALDGVVEAIEHESEFVIGTQWHPEMMAQKDEMMKKIFVAFVNECNKK